MKPFLISIAAWAFCAFGSPLSTEANGGLGSAERSSRGIGSISFPSADSKETILSVVSSTLTQVREDLQSINETLASFKSGGISKDEASNQASSSLQTLSEKLSGGITRLSATPSPGINPEDLDEVLKALDHIVNEIIITFIDIIKFLGSPQLASVLKAVLEVLYDFLSTIANLVDIAIPAGVKLLVPFLKVLRNAIITIVIGLLV
ncbi:hypothetical protein V2A60_008822 [Cordyceps javanica]